MHWRVVKPSNNYSYEGEFRTKFSLKRNSELYTTKHTPLKGTESECTPCYKFLLFLITHAV